MSAQSALGYAAGQCARFVADAVDWIGKWGDAKDWATNAQRAGLTVNRTPTVGSVVVWGAGVAGAEGAGHVAEVVGFQQNLLPIVAEENWGANGVGLGRPDFRALSSSEAAAGQYIQPPAGATLPAQVPASIVSSVDVANYTQGAAHIGPGGIAGDPNAKTSSGDPFGDALGSAAGVVGQISGVGSVVQGAVDFPGAVANAVWTVFSGGIANFFSRLGHGIASFISGTADGLGGFAKNHAVPLFVAGVVTAVLFA